MRRTAVLLVAATTSLATLLSVGPAVGAAPSAASPTATAESGTDPSAEPAEAGDPTVPAPAEGNGLPATPEEAEQALDVATDLLVAPAESAGRSESEEPQAEEAPPVEATVALRDLRAALPLLRGEDRVRARALLARPSDGAGDPFGDGYTTTPVRLCGGQFCVHYVQSTSDAASVAWAQRTLAVMNEVWSFIVTRHGYRPPLSDGTRGGDGRFDVYLADTGNRGVYGYCSTESRAKRAPAYCVLDNDFTEFRGNAVNLLRVTAVHEFFHAVQFAYDAGEDRWMLETSATWMEEQFADGVNDNRQYLRYGQVAKPAKALDSARGFEQYGNWAFWQFLSERYGPAVVRRAWEQAAPSGSRDYYSVQAIGAALRAQGGLKKVFPAFTAANATPRVSYAEGRTWPSASITKRWRLTSARRTASLRTRIDHLSSKNVLVTPAASLRGRRWVLRVKVNGPGRATRPAATIVMVGKKGRVTRKRVALNRAGNGTARVAFGAGSVRRVMVNLNNGSTRYRCGRGGFSCSGKPRDDGRAFAVSVTARRR